MGWFNHQLGKDSQKSHSWKAQLEKDELIKLGDFWI